jgi:hypothetical protein
MRLSVENLRGRTAVAANGQVIGEIAAMFIDSEQWKIGVPPCIDDIKFPTLDKIIRFVESSTSPPEMQVVTARARTQHYALSTSQNGTYRPPVSESCVTLTLCGNIAFRFRNSG